MIRTVKHHSDHVTGLYFITAFYRGFITHDKTGIGSLLDAVAADARQMTNQKLVYTQQFLAFVGFNAVVLIKRRTFVHFLLLVGILV